MSDSNVSYGGPGLMSMLAVAFVVLKLTGVIVWSWWWVLSPLLFSISFVFLLLIVVACIVIGKGG